jgi:hypothetical protein
VLEAVVAPLLEEEVEEPDEPEEPDAGFELPELPAGAFPGEEPELEEPDDIPIPFGRTITGALSCGITATGGGAMLTTEPTMDLPSSEICLAVKLAYTAWPTRRLGKSFGSVTLNWNALPVASTLAETAPVFASIAVIEQHGACARAPFANRPVQSSIPTNRRIRFIDLGLLIEASIPYRSKNGAH